MNFVYHHPKYTKVSSKDTRSRSIISDVL